MNIRPYRSGDDDAWAAMRAGLWPESSADEHADELHAVLASPDRWVVLFAEDDAGAVAGFVEASLVPDPHALPEVPGVRIEGWWVAETHRRQGIGRALVAAAAAWGRDHGAQVLLSDAELDNARSIAAHAALGFEETGRVVMFRRELD